jgi:hypothetical protein
MGHLGSGFHSFDQNSLPATTSIQTTLSDQFDVARSNLVIHHVCPYRTKSSPRQPFQTSNLDRNNGRLLWIGHMLKNCSRRLCGRTNKTESRKSQRSSRSDVSPCRMSSSRALFAGIDIEQRLDGSRRFSVCRQCVPPCQQKTDNVKVSRTHLLLLSTSSVGLSKARNNSGTGFVICCFPVRTIP